MKRHLLALLVVVCLPLSGLAATQTSQQPVADCPRAMLPPNLLLPGEWQAQLAQLWRRSPTFRQQCARLAQASWLQIRLRVTPRLPAFYGMRAVTTMQWPQRRAEIRIFASSDFVELVGHEFEHVLEQLEGTNLAALVAAGSEQVSRRSDGVFETTRAVAAGRRVKTEYNRARPADTAACSGGRAFSE